MKLNLSLLLCLVTLFSHEALSQPAKQQLIIAGDNWCPINCAATDPYDGFMIDVARIILSDHNIDVIYQEMPWLRALSQAKEGKVDAIVGAFKDDAPDFIFPEHGLLYFSPASFFTRIESDWLYQSPSDLSTVKLGASRGYDYGELLNNFISQNPENVTQLSGDDIAERHLKSLLRSRYDVIVESAPVLWHTAKRLDIAPLIREAGSPAAPEACHVAFSPKLANAQKLSELLNAGVKQLSQSGKLQKLASAYGLPEKYLPSF